MSTKHGVKLAVHIIESHFGQLVSKVCECLLVKGSLTLNQLVNHTRFSIPDVKKCLLVLIQHNCIQPLRLEQKGEFEGNTVSIQYAPNFANILHRLRFSKFLLLVTQKLGEDCAEVLQHLLEHGRLTIEQIVTRRMESTQTEEPHATHDTFKHLVSAWFVEHCPESGPFIEIRTDEETTSNNHCSRSSKVVTVEQRDIASRVPVEAERFLIKDAAGNEENAPSFLLTREKRLMTSWVLPIFEKRILWRPNFDEFIRCVRHQACVVHEKSRFDEGTAAVLNAMLEGSKNSVGGVISRHSVGRTMSLDHVRSSLDQLGCMKDADNLYSIDLDNIVQLCRNIEVESYVLKRYGEVAYKIFRLMSTESRFFETDTIAHDILKDKGETQSILFQLWKDNYLSMEKILVAAPKTKQFMLWKVDMDMAWKQILDGMYQSALNLINRLSLERNKEKELRKLPESKTNYVVEGKREPLLNIINCVESSLTRLDDAIMLFQDL